MIFSGWNRAIRERYLRKQAEADRDLWKARALALEKKIDERSDFFIEREFRLCDRFLTTQVKTFAITDEIRQKAQPTEIDVENSALEAFLIEKKEALVQWAREAGVEDPEDQAARDFELNRPKYILEFQGHI